MLQFLYVLVFACFSDWRFSGDLWRVHQQLVGHIQRRRDAVSAIKDGQNSVK